jgi:hypothetical protein
VKERLATAADRRILNMMQQDLNSLNQTLDLIDQTPGKKFVYR